MADGGISGSIRSVFLATTIHGDDQLMIGGQVRSAQVRLAEDSLVASDPCSCRRASVAMIGCVGWLVGWLVLERLPFHFLPLWTSCWQVASPEEFQACALPFSPVTGHSFPGPRPGMDQRLTVCSSYRSSTCMYIRMYRNNVGRVYSHAQHLQQL